MSESEDVREVVKSLRDTRARLTSAEALLRRWLDSAEGKRFDGRALLDDTHLFLGTPITVRAATPAALPQEAPPTCKPWCAKESDGSMIIGRGQVFTRGMRRYCSTECWNQDRQIHPAVPPTPPATTAADVLAIPCPHCRAAAGNVCRPIGNDWTKGGVCAKRIREAKERGTPSTTPTTCPTCWNVGWLPGCFGKKRCPKCRGSGGTSHPGTGR